MGMYMCRRASDQLAQFADCKEEFLQQLASDATEGATEALRFPGVESMRITFLIEKVVRDKGIPETLCYGHRQKRESCFMDDLFEWVRENDKLTDEDYLFTTYQRAPKRGAKTDKRLL
ncbi:hypothetical protein B484DRAFT_391163 [Ochromonadaceae sp. CCMP2298]|nr:hypothetical protein B484DRAFT_391163 [Ochromonadaceae sp. CCMP2298]